MASNRVGKAGPDKHDEIVTTFRKEEDNTYTKLTKILSRDWKTGGISQMKRLPPTEEGPYVLSTEEDYDEKVEYEDIDKSIKYIYFKLVEKPVEE